MGKSGLFLALWLCVCWAHTLLECETDFKSLTDIGLELESSTNRRTGDSKTSKLCLVHLHFAIALLMPTLENAI